jgi:hypothetical protein
MLKVAIATSYVGHPCMEYCVSIAELILYFASVPVFEGEKQAIRFLTPENSCVLSANRERHADAFLASDFSHLLFVDADMAFEPQALHIMARRKLPYVACNYPMKRKRDNEFTALSLDKKHRVYTGVGSTGIEQVDFTGFGFALIERQVLEQVKRPRFLIGYNTVTDIYTTEDAPFCHKVAEAGLPVNVDHDASKLVWHMGSCAYRWEDVPKPKELENG